MAEYYTRVRRRITPVKKSGSLKVGGFFPMTTQGGVPTGIWSPVEIKKQFFNYQAPYLKAEITLDRDDHKGPPYYEGGDFKNLTATYTDPYDGVFGKGTYYKSDGMEKYVGGWSPPSDSLFGDMGISNPNTFLNGITFFPDLSAYGARAWNKCKPKIEFADAYVFLKEFKDSVRMVKTTAKLMSDVYTKTLTSALRQNMRRGGHGIIERHFQRRLRAAMNTKMMSPRYVGDQFLNRQFGWLPFLSDIRKFSNAYDHFIEINARLTERNGQWRRRKVTVETGDTTNKISSGTGCSLTPGILSTHWSHYFTEEPTWELNERIEYVVSAVGSYRYYLQEFDQNDPDYESEWYRMRRQLDIFGARISPINVYRAIPWSWANDWLNNSSTYLEYVSDALMNNLAAKYFYVMGHWKTTRTFIQRLPLFTGPVTLSFERVIETKQRLGAGSPFDFNLQWSGLSPLQLAIAGALAVTRKGFK